MKAAEDSKCFPSMGKQGRLPEQSRRHSRWSGSKASQAKQSQNNQPKAERNKQKTRSTKVPNNTNLKPLLGRLDWRGCRAGRPVKVVQMRDEGLNTAMKLETDVM